MVFLQISGFSCAWSLVWRMVGLEAELLSFQWRVLSLGWYSCSFMVPTVLSHRLWERDCEIELARWLVWNRLVVCMTEELHRPLADRSLVWRELYILSFRVMRICIGLIVMPPLIASFVPYLSCLLHFFCYCYNQVVDHAHQQKFLLLPFLTMWIAFFLSLWIQDSAKVPYWSMMVGETSVTSWCFVFLLVSSRKCLPRSVFAAHSRSHPCVHQAGVLWGAGAVLQPEAFGLVLAVMFGQRCGAASSATNWSIGWPMQMQHYGPTLYIDAPKKFHESESDNSEEFHFVGIILSTSETRSII